MAEPKMDPAKSPAMVVIMGTSGSGKSLLGRKAAAMLGCPFVDGDDLHPLSNVRKMESGTALTDADRQPWLGTIRSTAQRICEEEWAMNGAEIAQRDAQSITPAKDGDPILSKSHRPDRPIIIIACSALKLRYRDQLRGDDAYPPPSPEDISPNAPKRAHLPASAFVKAYFIYLHGEKELLQERMKGRKGHFFGSMMLESQLNVLEEPKGSEPDWARVEVDQGLDVEVEEVASKCRQLLGI